MYDIGGADITVQNTIFHKNWKLGTNGNLSLKFPNRDTSHNGVADNKIDIQFNTFSTFRFTPTEAWYCSTNPINYNNTGYAKISDNYIDASVWSADPYNIVGGNYFDYKRGDNVAATAPLAPQPCELTIDLNTGTTSLNESYTKTPIQVKNIYSMPRLETPLKLMWIYRMQQEQPANILSFVQIRVKMLLWVILNHTLFQIKIIFITTKFIPKQVHHLHIPLTNPACMVLM